MSGSLKYRGPDTQATYRFVSLPAKGLLETLFSVLMNVAN